MRPLALLVALSAGAHAQIGSTPRAIVQAYNETAERVAARAGGEADPSRGAYQDAWEALPRGEETDEALKVAVRVAIGEAVEAQTIAPACRRAFGSAAAAAGIPGPACAALAASERAIDALIRGAEAGVGASPMDLWDPWHAKRLKSRGGRVGLGFIVLARVGVLQGYLWARTGKLDDALSVWLATARMGHDLGRGPLVQHMLGVVIQRMAWRAIAAQLRGARPGDAQLERLRRAAAQLGRPGWRQDQVMQAEYLVMFADMMAGLRTEGAHYPPAHEFTDTPVGGLADRILFARAMPQIQAYWEQIVRVAGAPWPQRAARYADLDAAAAAITDPIARIASVSFARFDMRARYQAARWKLLEVLAADALGAPVDRADPLTGRPVRETTVGALKHYKSSLIGHPRERELSETDRDAPLAIATPVPR